MKQFLYSILFLAATMAYSQDAGQLEWPRAITAGDYTITLYQPQLETFNGNMLSGRMALSVKDKKDEMTFGVLWFDARLDSDKESRTAELQSLDISRVKFPDIDDDDENIKKLKELIESDIEKTSVVMSLDDIRASLESVEMEAQLGDQLNNTPPVIYFRKEPTVLVTIDGEPRLKKVENSDLQYVQNTPFFIVKGKNLYYLKGERSWYDSKEIVTENWKATTNVPKDIQKLAEQQFEGTEEDPNPQDKSDVIPKVIVVDKPSELVVTSGELEYESIKGTNLLFVSNTENDIIMDVNTQLHYLLLNGRWYASKSLKDAEWTFTEPEKLPKEFADIPAEGTSISSVRVSVPGTKEAEDAVYEQYIPQTAKVDRKTAKTEVTYDGEPKFEKIEGTDMLYAVNTASTVIKVDGTFFVVDEGIWFQSKSAEGPWEVSDSRPADVDSIPPSSPVYNVKYVYVYDSTPEVVYVGYTPGYYHSYYYGGVVFYGTGFYYRPWYGYYYYPRPVTYGFGIHYNPYTGWGFSVGVSFGWMTFRFGSGGYWGPGGYMHGYRHGYYRGYHHGYHNGYRAGYARGRYDSRNAYRGRSNQYNRGRSNSGRTAGRTGVTTRDVKRSTSPRTADRSRNSGRVNAGDRVNTGNRGSGTTRQTRPNNRKNNVYSDRNGNVYQRSNSGSWEQKRNTRDNSNSRINSGNRNNLNNRMNQNQGNNRANQMQQRNRQQQQQLNRQYQNRSRGNTNSRNYNQNRSRPSPSRGGMRGGGGRGGGRRF